MHVVATAGHVDHGKSSLVLALTGTDPDRFTEEKERGLTIDLGFAWTELPSGAGISFVDVPGHVRFLKNMLAGVGAVDACMFVVAATEGWKPQSEEHLRILDLLGLTDGVVALTKVDLVDDELRELAVLDVEEHLEGSFLADAEIVGTDAVGSAGLDDVRSALDRLVKRCPTAADVGRPRLWVDRAFAAKGAGTVVTGTLAGGSFAVDDEVAISPGEQRARIRAIQSRMTSVDEIGPGNRVALNLAGVAHGDVVRGQAVTAPNQWQPTRLLDASLHVLADLEHEISRRGAYAAYIGSGEHPVQLRVLGPDRIAPGTSGFVRLHLPRAVPVLPGDRLILRDFGRGETVGGGEVLDIAPVLPAAKAKPDRSVGRVIAERGWVQTGELALLTGEQRSPTIGTWVTAPGEIESLAATVRGQLESAGPLGLDIAGLDERERLVLGTFDDVGLDASRARVAAAPDPLDNHAFVAAVEAEPFSPPDPDGVSPEELQGLVRRGLIVRSEGRYFGAAAVEGASRHVAALLEDNPDGITLAEIRDALGTTRKYVLPLVAHLDATGVTRRRGDLRIGGPRLPEALA